MMQGLSRIKLKSPNDSLQATMIDFWTKDRNGMWTQLIIPSGAATRSTARPNRTSGEQTIHFKRWTKIKDAPEEQPLLYRDLKRGEAFILRRYHFYFIILAPQFRQNHVNHNSTPSFAEKRCLLLPL